jgi:hypothetical protein
MHGLVINSDAALSHHLFLTAQAQTVSQVLPGAEQDYRLIKMPALEHATLGRSAQAGLAKTQKRIVATDPH